MKVELKRVSFPILVLFFICKSSLGDSFLEQHGQQTSTQLAQPSDEQRRDTEVAKDFMRYFLMNLRNNYPSVNHYGRNTLSSIPFRPVRRIGSEFLGKRALGNEFLGKRRLGSEFLGKRRLGSEFLGKRSNDDEDDVMPSHSTQNQELPMSISAPEIAADKRALGNEFLGKRRPNLWDWSWKRGLGSGRVYMGSEFLGKRDLHSSDPEELQEGPPASLLQ